MNRITLVLTLFCFVATRHYGSAQTGDAKKETSKPKPHIAENGYVPPPGLDWERLTNESLERGKPGDFLVQQATTCLAEMNYQRVEYLANVGKKLYLAVNHDTRSADYLLCYVYTETGRAKLAVQRFREMFKLGGYSTNESPELHALAQLRAGNVQVAQKLFMELGFAKGNTHEKDFPDIRTAAGLECAILLARGQAISSDDKLRKLRDFQLAHKLYPQCGLGRLYEAKILQELNRPEEALSSLKEAIGTLRGEYARSWAKQLMSWAEGEIFHKKQLAKKAKKAN